MNGADAARPVRPLDAAERRVLGTLIEKGKTTPDQYPLSLNALVNGCNQKSNRDPVTSLDEEQVTRALAGLRQCGAIAEVYGNGKIARYRHLAYEWLGASKEELAILGELLLRGAQTEGDLRGRASRMDEIPDLDVLRQHLDRLAERGLVVWLSPPGRGRMLTHGLLPPEKLEKVRSQLGMGGGAAAGVAAAMLTAEPVAAASRPVSEAAVDRADEPLDRRVAELEALGPLLRQGQFDPLFDRIGLLNQSDPDQVYLADGEAILRARLQQQPGNLNDLYALAIAQALQRHAGDAALSLRQLQRLDPGNPNALIGLGVVELYRFHPWAAQAVLDQAARITPSDPTLRTLRIVASALRLDLRQALSLLQS